MSTAARITKPSRPARQLPPAVPPFPVRRFTVAEYHRLLELGILRDRDPYELLNGQITYKMPQNTPHASAASRLERRLARLLPDGLLLRADKPVSLPRSESEPEPDVVVVVGPEEKYDAAQPGPKDVALVAEVADSSLPQDQGDKLRIYAAARSPVYWIVNIPDRRVEVYTLPRGGKNPTYRQQDKYGPDAAVPVVVAGTALGAIPVNELLP